MRTQSVRVRAERAGSVSGSTPRVPVPVTPWVAVAYALEHRVNALPTGDEVDTPCRLLCPSPSMCKRAHLTERRARKIAFANVAHLSERDSPPSRTSESSHNLFTQ